MKELFSNFVGRLIKARYSVEVSRDGADYPQLREGFVVPMLDENGSLCLDDECGEIVCPFDQTFEFIN